MDNAIKPNEPEATASMPMLPEPALPGGFALVIDHFISEITDCTQQQKTSPRPFPSLSASLFRDVYKVCIHLRLSRFTNNIPKTG